MRGLRLSTHPLHGQAGSRHREFQLASSLPSVATLNDTVVSEAKPIHERATLMMQELEWRPRLLRECLDDATERSGRRIVFGVYQDPNDARAAEGKRALLTSKPAFDDEN